MNSNNHKKLILGLFSAIIFSMLTNIGTAGERYSLEKDFIDSMPFVPGAKNPAVHSIERLNEVMMARMAYACMLLNTPGGDLEEALFYAKKVADHGYKPAKKLYRVIQGRISKKK